MANLSNDFVKCDVASSAAQSPTKNRVSRRENTAQHIINIVCRAYCAIQLRAVDIIVWKTNNNITHFRFPLTAAADKNIVVVELKQNIIMCIMLVSNSVQLTLGLRPKDDTTEPIGTWLTHCLLSHEKHWSNAFRH